jgi:hypothetical protein
MKNALGAIGAVAAASVLVLVTAVGASAYPAGTPMILSLQKSAYSAGATNVRVKAAHVKPGCIVTFGYDNQNLRNDDTGDYDENDAVAVASGNTPYASLVAPRVAGDYSLIAQTESYCTPTADDRATATVRVGKAVSVTINYNTAVKKTITVSGTVRAGSTVVIGQLLNVSLINNATGAVVKTIVAKSTATGYTAKFTALTAGKVYKARVTITANAANFLDTLGGTVTSMRLAKVAR